MVRENNNSRPKKEKPPNEKHKTVYFNTNNPSDKALFKYAQSVGVRNFSGFVKSLIYQEMVRRNGEAPNPYEYANIPMGNSFEESATSSEVKETPRVRVPVRKNNRVEKVEEVEEENDEDIKFVVGGKRLAPKQVIEDNLEEEDQSEDETENEEDVQEEQTSQRAALAQGMLNAFKRN